MFSCSVPSALFAAVTRGWNGYQNRSQHKKLTLEKKILPPLLQGFETTTFRLRVRRSNHWAIPAPHCIVCFGNGWKAMHLCPHQFLENWVSPGVVVAISVFSYCRLSACCNMNTPHSFSACCVQPFGGSQSNKSTQNYRILEILVSLPTTAY